MTDLLTTLRHYLLGGGLALPPWNWVGLPVLGAVVGYASGLFGVGGGFMLTPLLHNLLGVPIPIAVGSGLAQMIVVSITAARKHAAAGYVDPRLAGWMAPGVVAGAYGGKALLDWLGTLGQMTVAGRHYGTLDLVINGIFFLLLAVTAARLWREQAVEIEEVDDGPLRWAEGPAPVYLPASGVRPFSAVTLLLGGGIAGVMAGLLGVGGGIVVVPLLVYGFGISIRMAIGTSSALVLISAIFGTLLHLLAGHVNLPLVLMLLVGSFLGVRLGVRHSHRLQVTHLQRAFAGLVLAVALMVLANLIWGKA